MYAIYPYPTLTYIPPTYTYALLASPHASPHVGLQLWLDESRMRGNAWFFFLRFGLCLDRWVDLAYAMQGLLRFFYVCVSSYPPSTTTTSKGGGGGQRPKKGS